MSSEDNEKVKLKLLSSKSLSSSASKCIDKDVLPLVHPEVIPKSSKDPHKGLYPQKMLSKKCSPQFKKATLDVTGTPFQKASDVYKSCQLSFKDVCHKFVENRLNTSSFGSSSRECFKGSNVYEPERKKKKLSSTELPKNTLNNYFSKIPETETTCNRENKLTNQTKLSENIDHSETNDIIETNFLIEDSYVKNINQSAQSTNNSTSLYPKPCSSFSKPLENNNFDNEKNKLDVDSSMEQSKEKYFGLFGTSDELTNEVEETITENYFSYLPIPVLEHVFSYIPFLQMCKLKYVCKSWNEIISNSKFVQWKKAYYEVKYYHYKSECWDTLEKETESCFCDKSFIRLIEFVSNNFKKKSPENIDVILSKFPKCVLAKAVVLERLPSWKAENLSPWCILAAMILLSETVHDIFDVFSPLIKKHLDYQDVLEFMYCIATILIYYIRRFSINHGLHYRLFYGIYLIENETPPILPEVKPELHIPGQQSIHNFCTPVLPKLTLEQTQILNHKLRENQRVKIIAFAGTGKTSTLIHFARIYPNLKFLNIMFNRAVCDYASTQFPPNVVCKTAHSLAFQGMGKFYRHKMNFNLKPHNIMSHIEKPESITLASYSYAKVVLSTIENFCVSSDEQISIIHVPKSQKESSYLYQRTIPYVRSLNVHLNEQQRLGIVAEATKLWEKMADKNNKDCRITHDMYLKLYQLTHPSLFGYNCIMVDEAQDCNPAMLDIVLSQNVPVILVGDPYQQIYSFRGAVDALQSVRATHTYHLTKSFRFGPEIAYIASCCIETLKCNMRSTLVGTLNESHIDGTSQGQIAIIARTIDKLFSEAVRLCCTTERRGHEPLEVHGCFAGGISGYKFDQVVDIYKLQSGKFPKSDVKDLFVKRFKSFNDLRNYAQQTDDRDMLAKIDIVNRYGERIIEVVNTIKMKCSFVMELANVVFSTAHRSKGLEFDTVVLTNDYQVGEIPSSFPGANDPVYGEEFNILYVALTRAKKCLIMNEKLHLVLLRAQEKFQYPVSSSKISRQEDTLSVKCSLCYELFIPHTCLVLVQRQITLACGRILAGGPLCMKCATKPHYIPEVHRHPAVMRLDYVRDSAHISMQSLVGPLPSEPAIEHEVPPDNRAFRPLQMQEPYVILFVGPR